MVRQEYNIKAQGREEVMAKKVITRTGWIGKDDRITLPVDDRGFIEIYPTICSKKDNGFFNSTDYPPRKVRITIEEL